ncbi:MAG: phenylalanine--tRNA ligase subunit beta [Fretibacterium sp.]|nr:phenylalanine--tRNA ligase subunit beta [Fretibacterium sp.]
MLVSWNLLSQWLELSATPEEAAERLTMSGAEVEGIERPAGTMKGVLVAEVKKLEPHPTRDQLLLAALDLGGPEARCVTGAHNLKVGDRVFYAPPGAVLPDGTSLGTRDFGGVASQGMLLSGEELSLSEIDDGSGILVLPQDAPLGTDARTLYGLDDVVLDVSITPNRGDLLSLAGMARELKGLFPDSVLKTVLPPTPGSLKEWPVEFQFQNISLPDPGCLCYHLGLATGVRIGPAPLEARVALLRMGMRPISNVVDATNYAMLMLGQPLHAFDLNTLPAREITVRGAEEGERIVTLDGKDRLLTSEDMLITSGGTAIALAGVMGGDTTEIRPDTRIVVLESACFSPRRVGHTSRRLGIPSEAAFRFSRTVDATLSSTAADYALSLIALWSGATTGYKKISAVNSLPKPTPVTLTKRKLRVYLGWDDMDAASDILEGFGLRCTEGGEESRTFLPPTARPDISIEEDLIEEIGRFRGYNDTPASLPGEPDRPGNEGPKTRLSAELRALLIARGYLEAMTYSFLPLSFPQKLFLPEDDPRAHPLTLANPISKDQIAMRTTLIPGLLNALKTSVASGWRGPVRLFEQGRVFLRTDDGHQEHDCLAGLVFNGSDPRTPWKENAEDFLSVKADVCALLETRGRFARFVPGSEPFGHAGQTAQIQTQTQKNSAGGAPQAVGFLARLKPSLEQDLDVGSAVYVFELRLEGLEESLRPVLRPASPFPASFRDISLLAPRERLQEEVASDIRAAAGADGKLLESVTLFDVYEGKNIPEGSRSLAFSLAYRAPDRTLQDAEVEKIHLQVRDTLTEKGYNIR